MFHKNYVTTSLLMILFIVGSESVLSQNVRGLAYYQSTTDVQIDDFEGRAMDRNQKQRFVQIMKTFFKKSYVLSFTKSESFYKQDVKLQHPKANNGIGSKLGHFIKGPQYKNVITHTFLQSQEFFGKRFLIKDKLHKLDWQITSESMKIGQYTCYKAIAKKKVQGIDWRSTTKGSGSKNSNTSQFVDIVAWFTTDIPVSHGPSDFWGLPGLILKIDSDRTSIICTKIIINPEKNIKIEKPARGEVVSIEKYHKITKTKLEEMKNRRRGRGNNKS